MNRGEAVSLVAYVNEKFGNESAEKLQNIRRGGDNNRKGGRFEDYYAAAKICEIAANHPDQLDEFLLVGQADAFIDDIVLEHSTMMSKSNYQAKNSSGAAGSWNAEIESRCRMQSEIDINYHKMLTSKQILLVSCEKVKAANDQKIPDDLKGSCFSEFFPYRAASTQLIYASDDLRRNLEVICGGTNLSDIDTAFRCMVSAWVTGDCEGKRSVSDIVGLARDISRPDLFRGIDLEYSAVPDWLHRFCLSHPNFSVVQMSGEISISFNGLEVNLGRSPEEPDSIKLQSLGDDRKALMFLMSLTKGVTA